MNMLQRHRNAILYAIGLVLVVVGAGLAAYSWHFLTEQKHDRELVAVAQQPDATPEQRQEAEGRDETEDVDVVANHKAAPTDPRAIYIDKINMKARTLPMATNPDGTMQAPINIFDAGWYTGDGAVRPGQKGVVIAIGHASGPTREGLFAYIDTLANGDSITIERGDGEFFRYAVTGKTSLPLDGIDMSQLFSLQGGDEGLNLVTCGGQWDRQRKTFTERVIVYAKRVE